MQFIFASFAVDFMLVLWSCGFSLLAALRKGFSIIFISQAISIAFAGSLTFLKCPHRVVWSVVLVTDTHPSGLVMASSVVVRVDLVQFPCPSPSSSKTTPKSFCWINLRTEKKSENIAFFLGPPTWNSTPPPTSLLAAAWDTHIKYPILWHQRVARYPKSGICTGHVEFYFVGP